MPVSNLALTTASRLPRRAAVVGNWNRSLVMGTVVEFPAAAWDVEMLLPQRSQPVRIYR
jgi:hypothetical protein